MESNRERGIGTGWIGWLLFFLLIFGARFAPPVANWLSQTTGLNITPGGVMGGLALLYVASLFIGPIIGMLGRSSEGERSSSSLPQANNSPSQSPFPPSGTSPSAPRLPPQSPTRLPPPTSSKTPGAPRWEPVIDPRILVFGIIGVVVLGVFFLVALLLVGAI